MTYDESVPYYISVICLYCLSFIVLLFVIIIYLNICLCLLSLLSFVLLLVRMLLFGG